MIVVVDKYWMAGIGLLFAGVIGLVTLHPRAQTWLEKHQYKDEQDEAA